MMAALGWRIKEIERRLKWARGRVRRIEFHADREAARRRRERQHGTHDARIQTQRWRENHRDRSTTHFVVHCETRGDRRIVCKCCLAGVNNYSGAQVGQAGIERERFTRRSESWIVKGKLSALEPATLCRPPPE